MDRVILVTGTVGAGKSTTAEAMSSVLWNDGVLHAVIDLDAVRLLRPPPPDDPFAWRMLLANVGSLAANYAAAGVGVLLLAGVVETASDLAELQARVPAAVRAVRLTTSGVETERRLRARHSTGDVERDWHLARFPVLDEILDRWPDLPSIDTTDLTPREVAERVLAVTAESR